MSWWLYTLISLYDSCNERWLEKLIWSYIWFMYYPISRLSECCQTWPDQVWQDKVFKFSRNMNRNMFHGHTINRIQDIQLLNIWWGNKSSYEMQKIAPPTRVLSVTTLLSSFQMIWFIFCGAFMCAIGEMDYFSMPRVRLTFW